VIDIHFSFSGTTCDGPSFKFFYLFGEMPINISLRTEHSGETYIVFLSDPSSIYYLIFPRIYTDDLKSDTCLRNQLSCPFYFCEYRNEGVSWSGLVPVQAFERSDIAPGSSGILSNAIFTRSLFLLFTEVLSWQGNGTE
jgi:hypothetical protein